MSIVEWSYHRKNCNSCCKTAAFLEQRGIAVKNRVDARTTPLVEVDTLRLIGEVNNLYVTRGTKVLHFDLKQEHPDNELLLEYLIGRSGKLRAPAIKVGKTLVVGFDLSTYEQLFD